MSQSPKSKRTKAALENPSSDNLSESKSGGQVKQQGPSGSGKPSVPGMDRSGTRSAGQGAGNEAKGPRTKEVTSTSRPSAGGPGAASLKGTDAMKTGGNTTRFADNRGGNS